MTVKVVNSKAEVNQVVKKIHAIFPEATLNKTSFSISLNMPNELTILSCLKFKTGWSLMFNDTLINLNEN
jgi:hypothetical protein